MTNHQPYTACAVCGRRIERHFERWVHRLPRPIGNDLTDFGKALGTFSLATAAHEALPRAECGSSCRPDMHHYDKNGGLAGIGLHTIACDTNNDRDFFDRGGRT